MKGNTMKTEQQIRTEREKFLANNQGFDRNEEAEENVRIKAKEAISKNSKPVNGEKSNYAKKVEFLKKESRRLGRDVSGLDYPTPKPWRTVKA